MNLILFTKAGYVDVQNLVVGLIFNQEGLFSEDDIVKQVKLTLDTTETYLKAMEDGGVAMIDDGIQFMVDTSLEFHKFNNTKGIKKLLKNNFMEEQKKRTLEQARTYAQYSMSVFLQSDKITYIEDGKYTYN